MSIPPKIANLTKLALSDRVLTYTERKTIVDAALKEGVSETEINQYLDDALNQRLKFYTKEELKSCPFCGAQIPLLSDFCLFCGKELNNDNQALHTPPPFAVGPEADIIVSENIRIANEQYNLKKCPDCGAPWPLISNICTSCGHVLHEHRSSLLYVNTLIANIKQSIAQIKSIPKASWSKVIKHNIAYIFLFLCVPVYIFLKLSGYSELFILIPFLLFMAFSIITASMGMENFKRGKLIYNIPSSDVSPLADNEQNVHAALTKYEMYMRQTTTLYGDDTEARKLLNEYQSEIQKNKSFHQQQRKRAITIIAVLYSVIILTAIVLGNKIKNPVIENIPMYTNAVITLKPAFYNPDDKFITPDDVNLTVTYDTYDEFDDAKFKIRINNVNVLINKNARMDTIPQTIEILDHNHVVLDLITVADKNYSFTISPNGDRHVYLNFTRETTYNRHWRKIVEDALVSKLQFYYTLNY